MSMEKPEPLITVVEVARMLSVPVSWVYSKAEAGELVHHHVGRYLRFRNSDIEAYLAAQRRGGEAR